MGLTFCESIEVGLFKIIVPRSNNPTKILLIIQIFKNVFKTIIPFLLVCF
jgi:hypothetical protein